MCVHARVFVHEYESGRNYIHAYNKTFFEGIMLVENEPPCGESWLRACRRSTYYCDMVIMLACVSVCRKICHICGPGPMIDPR